VKRLLAVGFITFLAVVAGGYLAWVTWRDPLAALPPPEMAPAFAGSSTELSGGRRFEHVRIDTAGLGQIRIVVSLPDPLPNRKLPLVVVLGGLATGERNIRHVTAVGDNAVIGYDWPIPTRVPAGLELLRFVPTLRDRALAIPGQVVTAIRWAQDQPWSDPSRVSLLGFSLGTLVAPSVQRLAAQHGHPIDWTVLAYGGAPIRDLVEAHPRVRPRWLAPALGHLAEFALWPADPSAHLPHLAGRFLVLEGRDDPLIPAQAAARLRELTPQPKHVVVFDGGHMGVGPGQERLLEDIIAESRAWLVGEGAVNPPVISRGTE
jgi:hypothetical protein